MTENVFLVYEKIAKYEFKFNWILIKNGERTVLSDGLMTNPEVINESILQDSNFYNLYGPRVNVPFRPPSGTSVQGRCGGGKEITCLYYYPSEYKKPFGLQYAQLISTFGLCKVQNELVDIRQIEISRDGRLIIINAKIIVAKLSQKFNLAQKFVNLEIFIETTH